MKTGKEIREFLEEIRARHHPSPNMGYERAGAISALEWVLGSKSVKPVIGRRM